MKMVIDMAEIFFDTLRSTYEYITKEELLLKINDNILNQKTISPIYNQIIESSGESENNELGQNIVRTLEADNSEEMVTKVMKGKKINKII